MIYNDLNFKKPLINQEKSVQKNLVYKLNIFHTQEVTGSSPVVSTRKNPETAMVSGFLIFFQNDLFVKAWVTVIYSTDFTSVSYQCAYPQLLWQSSLPSRELLASGTKTVCSAFSYCVMFTKWKIVEFEKVYFFKKIKYTQVIIYNTQKQAKLQQKFLYFVMKTPFCKSTLL